MLTRCPACRTAFRVRPEQLRLRHGRVRCGHCQRPFNALDFLLEEATAAALPEAGESAPQGLAPVDPPQAELAPLPRSAPDEGSGLALFVLEEADAPPPEQLAIPEIDEAVPELYVEGLTRHAAEFDPSRPAEPPSARACQAPVELDFDLDFDLPSRAAEPAPAPPSVEATAAPGQAPAPPPGEDPRAPGPASAGAGLDWDWPGAANPPRAVPEPKPAEEEAAAASPPGTPELPPRVTPTVPAAPGAAEVEAEENYPFKIAPPPKTRPWLSTTAVAVLTATLLVQGSLLFRNSVVQIVPESQPLLASLCARLGCERPLPREAGFIAVDSSELHPDEQRHRGFLLRTAIRNRAPFDQAYPHLELTLTDERDRPLARRVLPPAQWLPDGAAADAFVANGRLELSLPLQVAELAPVGYRVYAFYP